MSLGWDALTDAIPLGKVKLLKAAAGPVGRSAKTVATDLAKTKRFDGKLIDGFDNLGKALTLVKHHPRDLVELFLSADHGLVAIVKKLGKSHPSAVKRAAALQTQLKKLFFALTGIDDYEKCKEAFRPPPASPVLGSSSLYPGGAGYGQVKPRTLFFGGDPTSLVEHITWTKWGGETATGSGSGDFVWPGESVARGSIASATQIVAWDLGTCNGRRAYQKIGWYFPQYGQTYDSGQWVNVCTGMYSPSPTLQSCGDVIIDSPAGYASNVQARGVDCSTALSIIAGSPSANYLYDGESRFETGGLYCGTQGFDSDLGPPTLFECARNRVDILFEVTDA